MTMDKSQMWNVIQLNVWQLDTMIWLLSVAQQWGHHYWPVATFLDVGLPWFTRSFDVASRQLRMSELACLVRKPHTRFGDWSEFLPRQGRKSGTTCRHPWRTMSWAIEVSNEDSNKMLTNWWDRQNAATLKFDPKPSEAAFSAVFRNSINADRK